MSVNIKFIAKKANVSISTVSRVLNNSKNVSPELHERVMLEVDKYGYKPNILARSLIMNKSNLICVMMPNVSDMYHAEMLRSIEMHADGYGYSVIVSNIYSNFEKQKQNLKMLNERQIDGIILLHENSPEELEEIIKLSRAPIVLASVNIANSTLPSVGIDDKKAAKDAVSYLIRLGHKKIAGVFSDSYSLGILRKEGFCEALSDSGITLNDNYITYSECTIDAGKKAADKLMQNKEIPTAIFCVTDEIAIGVINRLEKHGYNIPKDISVFGFDNISLSSVVRPTLSTINQPIAEIGKCAMDMLSDILNENPPANQEMILPHNLVLRNSCAEVSN